MKRCIQILLLAAVLAPLASRARTETMAERKRRIERKYLLERTELAPGETVVPSEMDTGEEEILDSEKFKEPQVNLQRQEAGTPMPPRPRAPRPRPRQDTQNWLLAETPADEGDSAAADPYAWDASAADAEKKKPDRSAEWRRRDTRSNADRKRGSWYTRRADSAGSGTFDTRGSAFGATRSGGSNPYSTLGGSGLFGQQAGQGSQATTPSLLGNPAASLTKPFSAAPGQDALKTRFPGQTGSTGTDGTQTGRQSYTPYKSPYQTQRSATPQQQWGTIPNKQEFQRQDSFQKWKEKSPQRLDPLRDDAFIDDLMPKVRR